MGDRVRIGVCTGPADAALVRSMLSAHGIESVVGGEMHANLLGGLGGALIALDITVAAEDADEAVALLRDFREGDEGDSGEPGEVGPETEPDAGDSGPDLRFEQRKRIGAALLLAFCITFGTAHMYARAWGRGILLAALELGGFVWLAQARGHGGLLIAGCMLADAFGSVWLIKNALRTQLPVARTRQ